MTEANGRLVEAQRRGQNELYKLNDERMQLQLQYTQARDTITVANRPYHIIDQWPPQTHHYMPRDHSQYDPTQNATEMVNAQTRQTSEARGMPRMQNGYTVSGPSEYRPRSTIERTAMATQNSMQRVDLDYSNIVNRPMQWNSAERGEEFLKNRSYAPGSSILPSQTTVTQFNNVPSTAPMRHLTNAWPTLNHVAAQTFNPINNNSYSLARAKEPQSNFVQLPTAIIQSSVATQTCNQDTVLSLENVAAASTNVRDSSIEKNKCSLRLGSYGGASSVEQFLMRLAICKQTYNWTDRETKNQLICALTDSAATLVLKTDLEPSTSAEELIRRLKERFGSEHLTALHQLQLNSIRQQPKEGLAQLAAEVRRLSGLAFTGPRSHHLDSIETRAFIEAISDRSVALRVLEASPANLDEAVKHAIRLEGFQRAELDHERQYGRFGARIKTVREEEAPLQQRLQENGAKSESS